MAIQKTLQGFIFINELGQYAVPGLSSGFGPAREVINWVGDINEAHVFPHEAMMRRRFEQLKNCQSLKAVATREVLIRNWSEAKTEPNVSSAKSASEFWAPTIPDVPPAPGE